MIWKLPNLIAHRGASQYAPENTLIAMKLAEQMNVTWVEFDVQFSGSDDLVVIHDWTVNRTTDGSGLVLDLTTRQLRSLDAGGWYAPEYKNTKIPLLSEMLTTLSELNLGFNLEIKCHDHQAERIASEVVTEIARMQTSLPPFMISSFNYPCLVAARKFAPEIMLGVLTDQWLEDWEDKLNAVNAISLNVNHEHLTEKRVQEVKSAGKYVMAYVVNKPHAAQRLLQWGVDTIFSNDPLLLEE